MDELIASENWSGDVVAFAFNEFLNKTSIRTPDISGLLAMFTPPSDIQTMHTHKIKCTAMHCVRETHDKRKRHLGTFPMLSQKERY